MQHALYVLYHPVSLFDAHFVPVAICGVCVLVLFLLASPLCVEFATISLFFHPFPTFLFYMPILLLLVSFAFASSLLVLVPTIRNG